MTQRPRLDPEKPHLYLDWIAENMHDLGNHPTTGWVHQHLTLAELLVRTRMGDAQEKTTHADLIRDGVIEAPPSA